MRIDTKYHFKIKDELESLKNTVREFLEETKYVPFRAVDCDQDKVKDLLEKLSNIVKKKK